MRNDETLPLWTTMEIEVHSYCNRDCVWCPRNYDRSGIRKDASGEKTKKQMPTEKVYNLINQAADLGFTGIIRFHRLSEALWDPRYVEFARYAKSKGMRPCENTNCDPLREKPELCRELDGILHTITLGLYNYKNEYEKWKEMVFWRSQFKKTDVEFSLPQEKCWVRRKIKLYNEAKKQRKWIKAPCLSPSYYLPIRYDGEVMLCSEDNDCSFNIGNAFSTSLEQIWWSPKHVAAAKKLMKPGGRRKVPFCNNCYWGQIEEIPIEKIEKRSKQSKKTSIKSFSCLITNNPDWSSVWPYYSVRALPLPFLAPVNRIRRVISKKLHPEKKDLMLISLPRSGTDWFMKCLVQGNPRIRYYREFFNPDSNRQFQAILEKTFGTHKPLHKNIAISWESSPSMIEMVYRQTWLKTDWHITKENWSAFKVGFFIKYFDISILYRHRRYVLPGGFSKQLTSEWYLSLYDSLVEAFTLLEEDIRKGMIFCKDNADSVYKKCCAAHLLFSHKLFKEAKKFNIPVIDYEFLVRTKDRNDLSRYLQERFPQKLLSPDFITNLISSADDMLLDQKDRAYRELSLEEFSKNLLDILKAFNTHNYYGLLD